MEAGAPLARGRAGRQRGAGGVAPFSGGAEGGPPSGAPAVWTRCGPAARWCGLTDGREIVVQRSRGLRLILLRLFEERLAHPGRALGMDALFEAGWPGDGATATVRENRVYFALSRLRSASLSGLIHSRDDGFLLDPEVPARWRQVAPEALRSNP